MTINFETLKASLILYGLNAVYAFVLLAVGWKLSGTAQRVISRLMTAVRSIDPLVIVFVSSLVRYAVIAVVGIAVLQLFGIQTASLVAVLGATSLAIGLALQGTLSNLAAGVMLLLFRPFRIGDDVEVAGKAGKVRSLSLFVTELATTDNSQILLPNGSVWGSAIINRSFYPGTGAVTIAFPILAGKPATDVGEQLKRELSEDSRIDTREAPKAFVSKVIDLSDPKRPLVELTVTAKVKPSEVAAVKQRLLDRINGLLNDRIESVPRSAA